MNRNAVLLTDCPLEFQNTVYKKIEDYTKSFGNCEMMSVISLEDTPYIDKSIISKRFRAILYTANFYTMLSYSIDPKLGSYMRENTLNIGEIMDIIACDPARVGVKSTI
jgi:hypothetical protein